MRRPPERATRYPRRSRGVNKEGQVAQGNGSGAPGTGPVRSARRAILWGGLALGVVWLLVMYRGVIPLTAALRTLYLDNVKRSLPALWPLPLLVHMTCVGLPIALAVRRFGPRPRSAPDANSA